MVPNSINNNFVEKNKDTLSSEKRPINIGILHSQGTQINNPVVIIYHSIAVKGTPKCKGSLSFYIGNCTHKP